MNVRNEIKAHIIRAGFTMQELVDRLLQRNMTGATAFPIYPQNCSGRVSATRRSWSWLMCWGMTSYGRNGGRDK